MMPVMNMADPFSIANVDAKLKELADAIADHEEQMKRLEAETEDLRNRFGALENARMTIAKEMGALADYTPIAASGHGAVEADESTLKAKTLQVVLGQESSEGISASEVTRILSSQGEGGHVTPRVFYSMIYLNLMRLTETGELRTRKGPKGRLFYTNRSRSQP